MLLLVLQLLLVLAQEGTSVYKELHLLLPLEVLMPIDVLLDIIALLVLLYKFHVTLASTVERQVLQLLPETVQLDTTVDLKVHLLQQPHVQLAAIVH